MTRAARGRARPPRAAGAGVRRRVPPAPARGAGGRAARRRDGARRTADGLAQDEPGSADLDLELGQVGPLEQAAEPVE